HIADPVIGVCRIESALKYVSDAAIIKCDLGRDDPSIQGQRPQSQSALRQTDAHDLAEKFLESLERERTWLTLRLPTRLVQPHQRVHCYFQLLFGSDQLQFTFEGLE